ncbi:MAG: hypothetical protein JKY81_11575 [Colwellia sp.]|nr:hypothetical protein [Colwellia sp.]
MKTLTMNEVQEVNGGVPLIIVIPAAYLARKYGGKALAGAAGAFLGWLSEF